MPDTITEIPELLKKLSQAAYQGELSILQPNEYRGGPDVSLGYRKGTFTFQLFNYADILEIWDDHSGLVTTVPLNHHGVSALRTLALYIKDRDAMEGAIRSQEALREVLKSL